ncbi:MAG: PilZ domain-containing protein [Chitinispirillaceae bacterium]|nr:PilZ domain-containing protein [Chitinispirillaceae bacterium]
MAFEKVLSETLLPGSVRKEQAWKIITDYSKYPLIMDNVDKVEIIERNRETGISRWEVSVDDAPLYWVEKDFFNHRDFHLAFKSTEGDFDNINGQWRITDSSGSGIAICFEIEYNLGIPVIEEVLGPVLREKMETNMSKMVSAIKKELASSATDERRFPRMAINRNHTALQNGSEYELTVINLSAGGMMVRPAAKQITPGTLQLAVAMLDIVTIDEDEVSGRCRCIFRRPLEETVLTALRESLMSAGRTPIARSAGLHDVLVFRNEQELPVQLLELTAKEMRFYSQGAQVPDFSTLSSGAAIALKEIIRDEVNNLVRVTFSTPLSHEQHRMVADHFGKQTAS